jgi:hypothetical protein
LTVDEKPRRDGKGVSLGVFELPAGDTTTITVSNRGTDGWVTVDAVQLLPVK